MKKNTYSFLDGEDYFDDSHWFEEDGLLWDNEEDEDEEPLGEIDLPDFLGNNNIQDLINMYLIRSVSGKEDNLRDYVAHALILNNIPFLEDEEGNIYRLSDNRPILSAHLDQVDTRKRLTTVSISGGSIIGDANLGADDKNGVWIVLNLVIADKGRTLNFIFSTGEEIGGIGARFLASKRAKTLKTCPYCLVFDRKGNGDIIGVENYYCSQDLQADCANIGLEYGYTPTNGVWSDADTFRDHVACVNLSCGYQSAHTDQEHTSIAGIKNALAYGQALINGLQANKKYKIAGASAINDKWRWTK